MIVNECTLEYVGNRKLQLILQNERQKTLKVKNANQIELNGDIDWKKYENIKTV